MILYGARTGGDGIGGVSVLASETFTDTGPTKRPSVQVGDPFMEKLLIECTLELFAAGVVAGIQDLGGAGLSCATSELASAGRRRHAGLARPGPAARLLARTGGDPDERVAGADDGGRRARRRRAVPGDLREVGRRGRRDRRGHRDRSPRHPLARRDRGRRTAAVGRARRPDVRTPLRPPRLAGRSPGRRRRDAAATVVRRRAARDGAPAGVVAEPLRQVVDHRPVRPLRPGQHRAGAAVRRRHGARRRGHPPRGRPSRPTATAASASSTRTSAPSSRWPRPTATSRAPAPPRWRSPTASTSARRRTPT